MNDLLKKNYMSRNIYYFAANYDYEVLNNFFFKSERSNLKERIFYDSNIAEDIIYYDIIHIIQLSYSFIEKALKYLISYHDTNENYEGLKKTHNLDKLTLKLDKKDKSFLKNMPNDLLNLYTEFKLIKFDTIRYLDDDLHIKISNKILKNLVNYTLNYLRSIRKNDIINNSSNIKNNYYKFSIRLHSIEEIPKIIYSDQFNILLESKNILEEDKQILKSSYELNDLNNNYILKIKLDKEIENNILDIIIKAQLYNLSINHDEKEIFINK